MQNPSPYPPQTPHWQPQFQGPAPRRGWRTWSRKRKVWTSVGVAFAVVSVLSHAASAKNTHQADTAASKLAVTHSTRAPEVTSSTKPKEASEPKTVKATVDTGRLTRLRRSGDDNGAYCAVLFDANRDGTLHLSATLGERATTGTVVVDAQTATGGDWSDSYELVSAKAQGNPMNAGMALAHQWGALLRYSDVTVITAQLSPDDDNNVKLYNCAVAPVPGLDK